LLQGNTESTCTRERVGARFARAVAREYLHASWWAKRQPVRRLLADLEESQWRSTDELERRSSTALRDLLTYAVQQTPFYRSLGIQAGAADGCPSLESLPVLEKETLQSQADSLLSSDLPRRTTWGRTSGSTGRPLRVAYDDAFLAHNLASQWRGRGWMGVPPGDRILTLWGRALDGSFRRNTRPARHLLRNYRTVPAFDLSDSCMEEAVSLLASFRPNLIYGYSTAIYRLALRCQRTGRKLREARANLRGVQYTAETLFEYQRRTVEEVFQCPVLSEYGCSETGAFAFECPSGGLHLSVENVAVEFLPLHGAEGGSIVATVLHNRAMPLIRYRVGDVGISVKGQCRCGRALPLMKLVQAKEIDMIHTPDGRVVSSELFDYINLALIDRGLEAVKSFQVVQTGSQEFFVQIEGWASEQVTRYWEQRMREAIGETISVRFEYVSRIPPDPSGKLRYFRRENG